VENKHELLEYHSHFSGSTHTVAVFADSYCSNGAIRHLTHGMKTFISAIELLMHLDVLLLPPKCL